MKVANEDNGGQGTAYVLKQHKKDNGNVARYEKSRNYDWQARGKRKNVMKIKDRQT